MDEKIILTLVRHPLWGNILQPLLISELTSEAFQVEEVATSRASYFPSLPSAQQQIVKLTEKYADKALMKLYSKEKITTDFLKKVTDDTIRTYIRPCIENYHKQIIALLPTAELPFYIRETNKVRVIYDTHEIAVSKEKADIVFHFIKDDDGFRYFIQISWNQSVIDLKDKSYYELCANPAIVVVDQNLFVFENINTKKLEPFFTKSHILVPKSSEKTYIEKFVVNCVKEYEVHASGFTVERIFPVKKAVLSLENDWNLRPVLNLQFMYDTYSFKMTSPYKKTVFVTYQDETPSVNYFYRDKDWEDGLKNLLQTNGLEIYSDNSFVVKQENAESLDSEEVYAIVDWMRDHQDVLQHFELLQKDMEKVYFVGEISLSTAVDSKQDWFDVKSIVIIGDFQIPFKNFRHHILSGIREYVLPNNQIAILPKEWFARYYEMMLFGKNNGDLIRFKRQHFALIEDIGLQKKLLPAVYDKDFQKPAPSALNAELRPYQQRGYSWLIYLYENHFGGCLADDMGLGKTLQTIALLQYLYTSQNEMTVKHTDACGQFFLFDEDKTEVVTQKLPPSLIVVPTSLMHNWLNELKRFAPKLKIYAYSGNKRIKSKDIGKIFAHYNIVLTTYGTLRNDIDFLQHVDFHYLILDESQYVKNPSSQAYKSVKHIQSAYKLILTGTPIENSLSDLWAQFEIINEGMLGSFNSFKKAYINPIVNQKNKEKEAVLLRMVQPFMLRRTKAEVTPELPPLLEKVIYCDMTDAQKSSYAEEKNKIRNSLLENSDSTAIHLMKNASFVALQGLTRLRLLANHPVLLNKEYADDSGKFGEIIMRFQSLKAEGHKVLIFSSFVKHLQLLADHFDAQSWKYAWLTGSLTSSDREREIKKFHDESDINCFFISLKAGGVGLNLTAADYVFIIDPWWNPAAEMQAVARSHRIGQEKNVMVYRFISSSTIEEKIMQLQEEKSALAETFVASSNPLSNMTFDDFDKLLENDAE